jgi:hypothetical protein
MAAKRIARVKKDALRLTKLCQKPLAIKPCRNRLYFRPPCHKIMADGITQMALNLGLVKPTVANQAVHTAVAAVAGEAFSLLAKPKNRLNF